MPEAVALIVVIARYLEPFTALSELAPALETTRATLGQDPGGAGRRRRWPAGTATLRGRRPRRHASSSTTSASATGTTRCSTDVSFTLEPGTTTAIVGPSGSGKSTILALIAGLHEPTVGSGAVRRRRPRRPGRRRPPRRASVVFQHPYLFDGTLRDNVLVGDPAPTPRSWPRATRLARVDELTARLPDGDATARRRGGRRAVRRRASAGEHRAGAAQKPPVLLVDEATSALDNENEAAVVDALTADLRPRTRVIVAHRLASIRHADRVLFVDDGRVVEDGSHRRCAPRWSLQEFWTSGAPKPPTGRLTLPSSTPSTSTPRRE